jgi:glycosyltransferase involved in cell wall biosynthesis
VAGDIVPLGPTFGIRLSSNALTRRHLAHTWRWALEGDGGPPGRRSRVRTAADRSRALLKHQRRRASIDAYAPRPSDADYVFFTAWPWAKHGSVNPPRIGFIEACRRAPGLTFEGGFAPRRQRDIPEVLPYTAESRYSLADYLDKVGRSAVAFNNPAVHGCLGWKLGEFLAMGKAIISLPIDRVLPAPLEHGVHLHVVDGSAESLDEAIARLRVDHAYRHSLELNARRWYDEHLAPERLASRILSQLARL